MKPVTDAKLFSNFVRILHNKGVSNANIARGLNASRHRVGSVIAHLDHPESFVKLGKVRELNRLRKQMKALQRQINS